MRNPCTQSINLNFNLINFPSPIQLSMNQNIGKFSLHQPKAKNLNNQSLPIHKKQSSSFHENFQDSFEQFHPTMSTESLCKVKKMYEKSIKNKGIGKSLDDFLNADVQDIVTKNSKTAVIKQLKSKNQTQSNVGSRQNTSKSNHDSQKSSKVSSRNSTQHMVSKQPQQIQCYNTFQQDDDFVKFDLLKNSLNVNKNHEKVYGKDLFKKKKSKGASLKNEKSLPNNLCDLQGHKLYVKSKQYKFPQSGQQNKPFSNNVKKSKSKSRSKSKQKSREKTEKEVLRKLNSTKNIKSANLTSKQLSSKSPIRHNTSKSPAKESQIDVRKHKQLWKLNGKNQTKRQQSKSRSRSKSKNQKKFVRSNIQIEISNHHTFSPSPATKRGNKSKSFQRSRSISNHKSLSKQKRSISKSANSKKIPSNNSKSPKPNKTVKEFNIKPKDLTDNPSKEMNKSRSLSKQKPKRSIVDEEKVTCKEKKNMKKAMKKQKMIKQSSQQILKSSQFSKNKYKKIAYAKPDARTSPDHSRSTNFYLPQRKESIKTKSKPQKQVEAKKQQREGKHIKNASKVNEKSKPYIHSNKSHNNQTIQKAVITIQRYYRGYHVRRQLNEQLKDICRKVEDIRGKIDDKRSKYWIKRDQQKENTINKQVKRKGLDADMLRKPQQIIKDRLKESSSRQQFESLVSSSNSIQQLIPKISQAFNNIPDHKKKKQSAPHLSNSMSRSITIQQNQKSQLLYLEQLVKRDKEQNEKFLRESEKLKQHIRSISGEHLKSYEPCVEKDDEKNKQNLCNQENVDSQVKSEQKATYMDAINFSKNQQSRQSQLTNQTICKQLQPNHLQAFQFYSPTHYILSPRNPSSSVLRMVSPISSASSFHHMQIPFSLQSPQNILNGENLNGNGENLNGKQSGRESKQLKERYFGAFSGNDTALREKEKKNHVAEDEKGMDQKDVQKKIDMLNKLYYVDKLLSPRTYERKMQTLTSKRQNNGQSTVQIHHQVKQSQITNGRQKFQVEQPQTGKKVKITELTQELGQGTGPLNRENISRVLFGEEISLSREVNQKGSNQGTQKCVMKIMEEEKDKGDLQEKYQKEQQYKNQKKEVQQQKSETWQQEAQLQQSETQQQQSETQQQQSETYQQQSEHKPNYQAKSPSYARLGFPTQLIFIKNYLFQFFTFIKSHPSQQKQLLSNLLSIPYDNQHLLTCYRTQLAEIDADYYHNRPEGLFLAYPYWKNLIDYEPIVGTDVFQRFSQWVQQNSRGEGEQPEENDNPYFCVTEQQGHIFAKKYINDRMSLKEIQRIFLMMLMDAFNEAFEEERSTYRQIALVNHQKGGMVNQHTVRQALKKIQQIENLQKSTPTFYLNPTDKNSTYKPRPTPQPQQPLNLQSSQPYQFFVAHQLRHKKQQLIDTIFCSVLKRVLQEWGRCMCGLIIEPQDEDEMHITMEQIQVKNTERLCLALNKYVEEYERELANVIKEHELCAKLVVADRVLEALVGELATQMSDKRRGKTISE